MHPALVKAGFASFGLNAASDILGDLTPLHKRQLRDEAEVQIDQLQDASKRALGSDDGASSSHDELRKIPDFPVDAEDGEGEDD